MTNKCKMAICCCSILGQDTPIMRWYDTYNSCEWKFTTRQKAVYNAVLAIYKETIPLYKPGMTIHKINDYVFKRMDEELMKRLYTEEDLKNQNPISRFSNSITYTIRPLCGLDVHDVVKATDFWTRYGISCEPGIYIAEEGIGVRIETDVVVADQPIDLFAGMPVEVEEIEALMKR